MIKKYKEKVKTVNAVQYTGANDAEIIGLASPLIVTPSGGSPGLMIKTPDGVRKCSNGDFVIVGVRGKLYVEHGETFNERFEEDK